MKETVCFTKNSSRKKYFALTNSVSSPGSGCSDRQNTLVCQQQIEANKTNNKIINISKLSPANRKN